MVVSTLGLISVMKLVVSGGPILAEVRLKV